ncbi:hypothetical protein DPEC_G00290480 [Dallia pectoralis]|uniref:Uncharacterized protein n=1 Tax=Dallia pectoralis TaxID=75939 RepID=A0ACC2FHG8_DALPE|nr:hypothetical protein DPEC_G00290480 [Dallia pectoralis]
MEGEEEWRRLTDIIRRWNNNRQDLFEISLPCKNLQFHGVMRFYLEDHDAGNVATKCLRISSTTTTAEVVETLAEKFRPDMNTPDTPYHLYEVHSNQEERQMDLRERPMVVQLNWKTDNREGRFILKRTKDNIKQNNSPEKKEKGGIIQNFKRTLSRKEKKEKQIGDDAGTHLATLGVPTMKKENGPISASMVLEKPSINKGIVPHLETTECPEGSRKGGMIQPVVSEEAFLSAVVNYTNTSTVHFKLSPAYVLYMAGRFVLHRRHSQDTAQGYLPTEHTHTISATVNKMVAMTEEVILKQKSIAGAVAFWMANTSELLNFLKQDGDLSPITLQAQENLAILVKKAYRCLIQCLLTDLMRHMPAFLIDPEDQSPAGIEGVLNNLTGAMSLLRRCRLNPALTIQLFSQLFHSISAWLFNRLLSTSPQGMACSLGLRSHYWGATLRQRLSLVEEWAERQGLELAADCHLSRIVQATLLLTMNKYSMEDEENIQNTCFKLNSLQLRVLMTNYLYATNEPSIPPGLIDRVVTAAESSADEVVRSEGRDLQLEEGPDLHLPFLLPEEGYSCDTVKGIPPGFREFLEPICRKGLCTLISHPHADGTWNIYFNRANSSFVQDTNPPTPAEPEVINITLRKPLNCGMGVSIVAAKDGRLTAGDQLLCVDGQSLVGHSQERAASIMMHTGPVVTLQIAKQGATYHGLAAILDEPSSVATTELNDDDPSYSCSSKPKKALIQQSSGHTDFWENIHHAGDRRQTEQTQLKNRLMYHSNPNIMDQALDEREPVDPFLKKDNKTTAVSTSDLLGSEMYSRVYLTLPTWKSQDKKTVGFELPPQGPRVSFNRDEQVFNKRTLMRQALSQENLCSENDRPLVDKTHNAREDNQLSRYYSSFPMKPCVSTHNIHSNDTVHHLSTMTSQSVHKTGSGYWRTPMSNNLPSAIQPIRIDIPVTQPALSRPHAPMTTFQQTPTLLTIKTNQSHEGKGQAHGILGNPNLGSHSQLTAQLRQATCPLVSMRKLQAPPTISAHTKQQKTIRTAQPTQSNDTCLYRSNAKQQSGTISGHQDQYFSMNKEQTSKGNNGPSPDPWKREAREKQQKQQRLQVVGLLEGEVCDLQSKTQLTPEETDRLRKLNLEWQFQKRLQEFRQNGDDDEDKDTSTEGSVQGYDEVNDNLQENCPKE